MSHFKTVLDFLEGVPAALKHEQIYLDKVSQESDNSMEYDLVLWEESAVGIGERNLLRDFPCPDKFTYPKMDEEMKVSSCSLAKQKGSMFGKGSLNKSVERVESFEMKKLIALKPRAGMVFNAGRNHVVIADNEPLYRQLSASLANISGASLAGPALGYLGEKLIARADMRHMFLKGYLMLMAYNLGVVSERENYGYNDLAIDVKTQCIGEKKLCTLMAYPIVIDVDHFTKEELWLLAEMGNSYPSRKYGVWNIYNHVQMEADTVAFVTSEDEFEIGRNPGYGSPERMWNDMVAIALKTNAMEDLREVVRDMRGVPGMLRSVSEVTGRNSFELIYPKSYSMVMAVESIGCRYPNVVNRSGYFATSKCLVVDLLLSKMMDVNIFNLLEEYGAFGKVVVPSGDAMADDLWNSLSRSAGLKYPDEQGNSLLLEWRGVRGCQMPVGFGGKLKEYVQRVLQKLRAGEQYINPQLMYALPYSAFRSSTWAVMRGWKFQDFEFRESMGDKVLTSLRAKAFTWLMGVGESLPMLGINAVGAMQAELISTVEYEYLCLAAGEYEIGLVRHILSGELKPRTDEYELGMTAFYNTNFPGTRCTIIFDDHGLPNLIQEEKTPYHMSTIGVVKGPDAAVYTAGGSKKEMTPPRMIDMDEGSADGGDKSGEKAPEKNGKTGEGNGRKTIPRISRGTNGGSGNGRPPGRNDNRGPPQGISRGDDSHAVPVKTRDRGASEVPVERKDQGESGREKKDDEVEIIEQESSDPPPVGTVAEVETGGLTADTELVVLRPPPVERKATSEKKREDTYAEKVAGKKLSWGDQAEADTELDEKLKKYEVDFGSLPDEVKEELGVPKGADLTGRRKVVMSSIAKVPFRSVPQLKMVEGKPVGLDVTLSDGKRMKMVVHSGPRRINPENFRGFRIKTPGDGTCGLHAIVTDWMLKGYVDQDYREAVYDFLDNVTGSDTWHDVNQLAAAVTAFKHGACLVDVVNKQVIEFGTKDAKEIVYILHDGNHYDSFVPHDNGNLHCQGFRHMGSNVTPWGFYENVLGLQSVLDADYIANVFAEGSIEKLRRTVDGKMERFRRVAIPKSQAGGQTQARQQAPIMRQKPRSEATAGSGSRKKEKGVPLDVFAERREAAYKEKADRLGFQEPIDFGNKKRSEAEGGQRSSLNPQRPRFQSGGRSRGAGTGGRGGRGFVVPGAGYSAPATGGSGRKNNRGGWNFDAKDVAGDDLLIKTEEIPQAGVRGTSSWLS